MKIPDISVELADDAYEVFLATRVIHCQALDCKFHMINFDKFGSHGGCTLKRIYITEGGICEQYEAKAEPND